MIVSAAVCAVDNFRIGFYFILSLFYTASPVACCVGGFGKVSVLLVPFFSPPPPQAAGRPNLRNLRLVQFPPPSQPGESQKTTRPPSRLILFSIPKHNQAPNTEHRLHHLIASLQSPLRASCVGCTWVPHATSSCCPATRPPIPSSSLSRSSIDHRRYRRPAESKSPKWTVTTSIPRCCRGHAASPIGKTSATDKRTDTTR